jgi:hypothetical protein
MAAMPSCFARLIERAARADDAGSAVSRQTASTAISLFEYPSIRSMWMTQSLPR